MSTIADKININARSKFKKADITSNKALPVNKKSKKKIKKKKIDEEVAVSEEQNLKIRVPEFTTVDELAQSMGLPPTDIIMKCMEMGMMVTINQRLDMENLILIADEFNFEIESDSEFGEDILQEALNKKRKVIRYLDHL